MKDGIYYDMPERDYHALPRLSSHGISKLLINPHDYWVGSFMNPNRAETKSKAFSTGKVYEVIYLDGIKAFQNRFAPAFDKADYPDALDTKDQLIEACEANKVEYKKSWTKADLSSALFDTDVQILEYIKSDYESSNEGKEIIDLDDYNNAIASYEAMGENPMGEGKSQVAVLWTDNLTGVPMKALLDYDTPKTIWDVKTFSNPSGIEIDRLIALHISKYGYYRQAAMYDEAMPGKEFKFLFVQTGPSFAYRVVNFPSSLMLFEKGKDEIRKGINLFRDCYQKFGPDNPWVIPPSETKLNDESFPMYVYE